MPYLCAMKQQILLISVLILLAGCGSKAPKQTENPDESVLTDSVITTEITEEAPETTLDADEVIQNAIRDYLMGNKDAVRFSERARQSLYESTWPEVQCSVEGMLDSPASFKDLTVKCVGAGLYKYECTCPDHAQLIELTYMVKLNGKIGHIVSMKLRSTLLNIIAAKKRETSVKRIL